ncbi:MAG TPA: PAS domain S-box protein [Burkholderiales bacterium]|nr:PAS domain S-box protein [Burkholderiales bacterium]
MATEANVDPQIYQRLVEQAKDYAVFVLHPDGRVMTWNLGAKLIKGYEPEEIIGRHFSIFYPREALDRDWPAQELKLAASQGRFEDEGWRVRKDGSTFWASVVITALRDESGKLQGFSKFTRDLTERKRHDEELRQSEERFRLLVEGVVDYAIFLLDPEGIVSSWNAGAERIKGYKRAEILGKHLSCFYTPEDIAAHKPWAEFETARRTGRSEDEGWRVKKNGERFWARGVLTALHDSAGKLQGFAKVTQDLSERRHIQSLELAAKNVNEFIAVLAHELRNPLAPIRAAVEVMAKVPAGDPAHEAMRQTIDRQSAQLARIVDDMIDISRISRGMFSIERVAVDMNDVVRRAVETAAPGIESAHHILEINLPQEALLIRGDAYRLTQILTNILNNAARYTPQAGRITVTARAEEGQAVLRVRDNGRGVEAKFLSRIFDMFVQGRESLQRTQGGLGIGLALSRKLAEMHGGSLEAHSEGVDKGSEFTLRIPLLVMSRQSGDQRSHAAPPTALSQSMPKRVLMVDDNVDVTTTLSLLLKSLGHETCVVHNGAAALKMAVEFHPDVVLLDVGLPDIDGYEVARRLNALKPKRAFRIIAVTGWGQEADRTKAREAGFDLHLLKPVNVDELVRALSEKDDATLH